MFRVIIADDELNAISLMNELLNSFPQYHVVDKICNPDKLIESVLRYTPDLIFLDIKIGNNNGIGLAKEIKSIGPRIEIIFITAYSNYALEAFNCKACDYLLKPVSIVRLATALKHFEKQRQCSNHSLAHNTQILRFNTQQGFVIIKVKDIICLVADQVDTTIYSLGNKKHHLSVNIGKIQPMLDENSFIRSSRSSIININYLREVSRKKRVCILGLNEDFIEVKLSKSGIESLEEYFQL